MTLFYTYIWRDAAGVPFYVGKGNDRRAYATNKRSAEFKAVHALGGCTVEIVDEFILESQAHAHEIELIEKYGRREFGGLLVNKTDGGDGASGQIASAETRAKIGAAHAGKIVTEETREKIRASAKTRPRPSPESIAKTAAANRGRKLSPETRAKMSASAKNMSGSHKEKLSAYAKNRSKDHLLAISKVRRRLGPKSGFKGVSKGRVKWRAEINPGGNRQYLGLFASAEDAARAYDKAAYAAWGDDCFLNFPEEIKQTNSKTG